MTTTGIIHILNKTEQETVIKVVYQSNSVWKNFDIEHDVTVTLGRYYNRRRIKKYLQVVINRKRYFDPYLGTKAIGPIKAKPINNGGECTYISNFKFA